MPASSTQYGSYQPNAVDPYPIESVLAPLAVGNNPANATNMLDEYQMQRLTDAGNYQYAANQQHDFAKQQLAQQLQEQYLKSGQEALKTPGGLTLLRSQAPDALGPGFGPAQQGIIETSLANARDAKTANEASSAAWHGVQAGYPADLPRLTALSGGLFQTQGTPLSTANIALKGAMGGGGHGGGAGKTMSVPYKQYVNDDGQLVNGMIKVPLNATDEQVAAIKANADRIYAGINPKNGTGVPGMTPPSDTAPQQQPFTPSAPKRNLPIPNNPAPAPQAAPSAPSASSGAVITNPRTQGLARQGFQHLSPQARADVGANIQGAVMPVVPLKGGGIGYVGKSGQVHTLPPPGSN